METMCNLQAFLGTAKPKKGHSNIELKNYSARLKNNNCVLFLCSYLYTTMLQTVKSLGQAVSAFLKSLCVQTIRDA